MTVTQLPVTGCEICHRTVAYRPGSLSEDLTEYYRRAHPEVLGVPPGSLPQAARIALRIPLPAPVISDDFG
jgi:hypothetical protein